MKEKKKSVSKRIYHIVVGIGELSAYHGGLAALSMYTELPGWSGIPLATIAAVMLSDSIYRIGFNTTLWKERKQDVKDRLADKVAREVKLMEGQHPKKVEPPTDMGKAQTEEYEHYSATGPSVSAEIDIKIAILPEPEKGLEFASIPTSEYLRLERSRYSAEK